MAWLYIGVDLLADVYVYVKDYRYVYVKPRARGWRAPTVYIGKLEDVLAGLVQKIRFSDYTLKKLHEVYIRFLRDKMMRDERLRRAEERLQREIQRLKAETSRQEAAKPRDVERARELVEFLRDVLAAVYKYLTSLDSVVSRLMNLVWSPSDRARAERKLYEAKDRFFREILSKWELDRTPTTVLDVIEEAIQDAEKVLAML